VTEGAQNLNQAIREQVLKSAQDFYGDFLGSLKGQLQDSRFSYRIYSTNSLTPRRTPAPNSSSWCNPTRP
jgi:hypothetical protein